MDLLLSQWPDGRLFVTVRCIEAAASLAAARAHAIVVAALGLRARRLVRDDKRVGHSSQRRLEENRARAIAVGLRAQFAFEDRERPPRGGGTRAVRYVGGRAAVRELLLDLCTEFASLGASAAELAPVILPIELPRLGLCRIAAEDDLLSVWSARGATALADSAGDGLIDPVAGGALLERAVETAPGRVAVILDLWRSNLTGEARARGAVGDPARHQSGGSARRDRDRDRRGGKPARRSGEQRRRGDRPGSSGKASHD